MTPEIGPCHESRAVAAPVHSGRRGCKLRRLARLLIVLLPMAAQADAPDAELARRLVESGRILPLEQLLERVRAIRAGVLLEAELEYESDHQTYVYEIELLDDAGQVWELELDAETGELIELAPEHSQGSP
jgi:uncharacterized membrane protein YkoI